jgi:hypothetical protein
MAGDIYSRVQTGPYTGFTRAEMLVEFDRYKEKLTGSGSTLRGYSGGTKSIQLGPRLDWSLAEWSKQIRFALSQVSPDFIAPSQNIGVRFAGC